MASGPLDGVRILEFTQIIAGPLGCMFLSDMGAEVVKIEPVEGEPWRLQTPFMPLESKQFQSLNRGKQSLAIDLTRPESREAIQRLVRQFDVVVINYRPDVAERLEIDYETFRQIRPDLIYVDATAFGRNGPLAMRPGYDIVIQAASGIAASGGRFDDDGNPMLPGAVAMADFSTGYAIAWGTCAALFHRERTGKGQIVQTSLLANALTVQNGSFMSLPAADQLTRRAFLDALVEARSEGRSYREMVERRQEIIRWAAGNVYYRSYNTKDGAISVGCLSTALREKMRQALEIEDIRDEPGYDPRAPESIEFAQRLTEQVEAMIAAETTEYWVELLEGAGVPVSPIEFIEELDRHPQVVENDYIVELDHDLSGSQWQVAPPIKMSDSPPRAQGAAPPLGRDSERVLASAGYSSDEIEAMRASGAIR